MIQCNDVLFFEDEFPKVEDSTKRDIIDEHCEFYFHTNDDENTDNVPVHQHAPDQVAQQEVPNEANQHTGQERRASNCLCGLTG